LIVIAQYANIGRAIKSWEKVKTYLLRMTIIIVRPIVLLNAVAVTMYLSIWRFLRKGMLSMTKMAMK